MSESTEDLRLEIAEIAAELRLIRKAIEKPRTTGLVPTTCRCDWCGKLATSPGWCPRVNCQGRCTPVPLSDVTEFDV